MNIWLSKIAPREWTGGPEVWFWFAIKLSRNQFRLLWIIQGLMEWEMAKWGCWVMRRSEGVVARLCDVHAGVALCMRSSADLSKVSRDESKVLRCFVTLAGELLSFRRGSGASVSTANPNDFRPLAQGRASHAGGKAFWAKPGVVIGFRKPLMFRSQPVDWSFFSPDDES